MTQSNMQRRESPLQQVASLRFNATRITLPQSKAVQSEMAEKLQLYP
jgi:hypothetical protein